jgi:membrane protease YdiL (CAAX protease family)
MTAIIRKLPPSVEMAVVLLLSLGLPIYSSMRRFLQFSCTFSSESWLRYTDFGIYSLTIYELIILFVLVLFLFIRNWRLRDFNLHFSLRLIGVAFLLIIARNIVSNSSYKVLSVLHLVTPELEKAINVKWSMTIYGLIPLLVINSIFEESIVVGYLFKRLDHLSGILIILLSTLIRQLYHLHQGPMSFFLIIPTGLVFSVYYWKYKRLTPLIIAHGIDNLIVFLTYTWHLTPP